MKITAAAVAIALAAAIAFAPKAPRVACEATENVAPVVEVIKQSVKGWSTWYDASLNHAWFTETPRAGSNNKNQGGSPYEFYAAAGPGLRALKQFKWGMEPYLVIVENLRNGRTIIATVVDWCECNEGKKEKLIDLSPAAFEALAGVGNLGLGVLKVRVTIVEE